MKKILLKYIVFFLSSGFFFGCANFQDFMNLNQSKHNDLKKSEQNTVNSILNPKQKGFAAINGINIYYELYGNETGIPLVLLHGGGSTIESSFGKVIPILSKNHRIIAMEEQSHGRTSDRNAPLRFATSAEDVVGLLNFLKIEKADLFGFSNGASIAIHIAIKHPSRVRSLVFASSITKRSGAQQELWEFIKNSDFSQMSQALKDAFLKVNSDQTKLLNMHDKAKERMVNFTDIKDEDLKSLQTNTLILTGDRDVGKLEHSIELTKLIPKSRLIVLPYGHGDYMGEASSTKKETNVTEHTIGLIEEFLAGNIE
ncbi:alpha/beta hydrolase [Leptospira sp. 96542]|nr:alpha/beta hydrolase [Leptospira sp. 96542]